MKKKIDLTSGKKHQLLKGVNISDVKVISVKDDIKEEYIDCKSELDLKFSTVGNKKIKITYKVIQNKQKVSLWLEYEQSKVHDDYYGQYKSDSFKQPIILKFVNDEEKEPGEYSIVWDGRDPTSDKRILLAGKYKFVITGKCKLGEKKNESKIEIAKPNSYNYGVHLTRKLVQYSDSKQSSLSDGTGFTSNLDFDYEAADAIAEWKNMGAIVFCSAHSNCAVVAFESGKKKSRLNTIGDKGQRMNKSPNFSLRTANKKLFKDILFMIFCSCRCANEELMVQFMLNSFNPGPIDGIHGKKTTRAIRNFQRVHKMEPYDGKISDALLDRLQVSSEGKKQKQIVWDVQTKLKSYYPGKADGVHGKKSRKGLSNYQRDHPTLAVTGEQDEPTLKALQIGIDGGYYRNIAYGVTDKGVDISLGFIQSVYANNIVKWTRKFCDCLGNGDGIEKAATTALESLRPNARKNLPFKIYTRKGISKQITLQPARYGKST